MKKPIKVILTTAVLVFILSLSAAAPWIAPHDPNTINMAARLRGPGDVYPWGTDSLGRDLLSRVLYGGRESIVLALIATSLSMLVGLLIGMLSGYFEGPFDWFFNIIASIFQGIPDLCFLVALVGILGGGIGAVLTGLVLKSWVGFSRIVRSEVMKLRRESYVDAARTAGARPLRILFSDILPNILGNVAVLFSSRLGGVILSVASLSFLGLGIQPPTPDWGVMVNDARSYFRLYPLLVLAPGGCIFALSVSLNILGDILRDRIDVRFDEFLS